MPTPAASLRPSLAGHARAFRVALADTRAVQERRLQSILARNPDCEYGRRHGFGALADAEAFRRHVPIVAFEEIAPAIERMAAGEGGVLVAEPVVAFEETGGSSGGAKLVPYTVAALEGFRRGLMPWLDDLYSAFPRLDGGSAYWSISPAGRPPRTTPGGVPIGMPGDAAYFDTDVAAALVATLCVPPEAGAIRDVDAWRHCTMCRLLADASLALISAWSPTFLLELLRHAQDDVERIAAAIEAGDDGLGALSGIASPSALRPDPSRAAAVRAALSRDEPDFVALWPRLSVVSCWDQAAARPFAEALRRSLPGVHLQGKGLLATEGLVSIPLHDAPWPVLAVDSGFYEFIDGRGRACFADEAEPGEEYDLVMTNESGFYRYAIGDRVRVHGRIGGAPMLEFLGRSGRESDLAGEKLTEDFVAAALAPLGLGFAMMVPRVSPAPGYVLVLDAAEVALADGPRLAERADAALCANPQYAYARRMRQLAPLAVLRCREPLRTWIDAGLARGQRLGDIKPTALCRDAAMIARFEIIR